jgi:hypothetical protein
MLRGLWWTKGQWQHTVMGNKPTEGRQTIDAYSNQSLVLRKAQQWWRKPVCMMHDRCWWKYHPRECATMAETPCDEV